MGRNVRAWVALVRPFQAYKAAIVWLPALFYGHGALRVHAGTLALAALAWWLASSCVYILNDLNDAARDRTRPERRFRPLASGDLSVRQALALGLAALACLLAVLTRLPVRVAVLVALYGAFNLAYGLGLKECLGARQAIVAIGFWLRLQSGAAPVVPIPLTPWAALFTLGLAYYLNCLKGLSAYAQDQHRGYRFAMGLGAGLAGCLALTSLVAICLKRGVEGTMTWPELPPLLCLVGMHRVAFASFGERQAREQALGFLADPVTILAIVGFVGFFIYA
jgi:4-hydroxybenzoate polyprenyltransferase